MIRVLKFTLKIINNRNFILPLSLVLGLLIRDIGSWIKYLTIPALAVVMIASLTQISFKTFFKFRELLKPVLYTILFNYFIFGAVMLVLAWFLVPDRQLWIGFVILASAPPGVAIAPFAYIIGGDEKFSIIGMVGAYIAAVALIPLAGIIFVGQNFIQPLNLFLIIIELIIAPMIISQILIKFKMDKYISKRRGAIINWGLFVVIFAVVALNREVFFKDFKTLGIISLISVVSVFGLWISTGFILKKLRFNERLRKSLILAATIKNSGFAAATALALFGEKASLPGAILSVFLVIFLIVIGIPPKKSQKEHR